MGSNSHLVSNIQNGIVGAGWPSISRQPATSDPGKWLCRSLEAALWAFYNSGSFEKGALLAVNLGDDADTTGAIYGQTAGAYYGVRLLQESLSEGDERLHIPTGARGEEESTFHGFSLLTVFTMRSIMSLIPTSRCRGV